MTVRQDGGLDELADLRDPETALSVAEDAVRISDEGMLAEQCFGLKAYLLDTLAVAYEDNGCLDLAAETRSARFDLLRRQNASP